MTTLKLSRLHDKIVSEDIECFLTQDNLDFLMNDSTARRLAKVYNFVNNLPSEDKDQEGAGCAYFEDLMDYIQECLGEASESYGQVTFPENEDESLEYHQTPEFRVSFAFHILLCEAIEKPKSNYTFKRRRINQFYRN
jgi:hypothetical protein